MTVHKSFVFSQEFENNKTHKKEKLKQDLVKERVESLKEASVENPVKHSQVQEVESLLSQGRWRSAGTLLNQIDQ